ncbi:MAG: membrane protein insertase YidC [Fidelibacterota bacterium]|nr:MAG: membrane protein insertase YidC [Candidatus Neomarinimicrobiota bacterium]
MTDTRKTVLAFILIALVLILTPRYLRWIAPAKEEAAPAGEKALTDADTLAPVPVDAPLPEPPEERETPVLKTRTAVIQPQAQAWQEEITTIETDIYRAVVSSRGGGHLVDFELKNYRHGSGEGNVQLIAGDGVDINLRLSYINLDGDSTYLVQNFEVLEVPGTDRTYLTEGAITLAYRHTFSSGARVTKRLTFQADSYTIPVEIAWEHPELELGINTYEIAWPGGLNPAEKKVKEDETYGKVYVYQGGELANQGSARKGPVKRQQLNGNTQWVALRNKYFTAAYISEANEPGIYGAISAAPVPYHEATGKNDASITRYFMAIGYDARLPVKMTLYLGPLSYDIIKDLDVDLERIMNLGFSLIRPISKLVLFTLVFFHNYIPNYGVILILFAIIVRVLTNPLTKKSAISTQKMQLVQPKVKALQEKYKGNPQKLNQETMALWKSEGVNPLGGCLPILIQMPVLFALFIVFRTTIELRGQPFILWVTDLSVPDVVYTLPFSIPLYGNGVTILAIIMGLTMFIQQKISGAGTNPQQKPMMYMMSGMFFLIFNQFPSGLNLYYAFSNILAIFQQRNVRRHLKVDQTSELPAKKKPKKS